MDEADGEHGAGRMEANTQGFSSERVEEDKLVLLRVPNTHGTVLAYGSY